MGENGLTVGEEITKCGFKSILLPSGRCRRPAEKGSEYCIFHTPTTPRYRDIKRGFANRFLYYVIETLESLKGVKPDENQRVNLDCRGFIFPEDFTRFGNIRSDMNVDFKGAVFHGKADFRFQYSNGFIDFSRAVFLAGATFTASGFNKPVLFNDAIFKPQRPGKECADFGDAQFYGGLSLRGVEFGGDLILAGLKVGTSLVIEDVEIAGIADFSALVIEGGISIIRVVKKFEKKRVGGALIIQSVLSPAAKVDFRGVEISPGYKLCFKGSKRDIPTTMDLGDWAFARTKCLKDAEFSNITWYGTGPKKRKHTRDEGIAYEGLVKKANKDNNVINCEAANEVYRYLRNNYESQLGFEEASHFHVGQMEMMLKNPKTFWTKRLGLIIYKIVSDYGEGVGRPVLWFCGLLLVFAGVWSEVGFHYSNYEFINLSYNHIWPWTMDKFQFDWLTWVSVFKALAFSFKSFLTLPDKNDTAGVQLLGAIQRALGAGVITLFILALRRAFRR